MTHMWLTGKHVLSHAGWHVAIASHEAKFLNVIHHRDPTCPKIKQN